MFAKQVAVIVASLLLGVAAGQGVSGNDDCTANIWGDPHIVTFDGLMFDAHPKGEAILLMDHDLDLEVQGRFSQALASNPLPAVTTGVAAALLDDYGFAIELSTTNLSDATNVILTPEWHSCPIQLLVNCEQEILFPGQNFYGDVLVSFFPFPGMEMVGSNIIVYFFGYLEIHISVHKFGVCYFSMSITKLHCDDAQVWGLLGSPNGNVNDDWMDRNGNAIPIPPGIGTFFFEPAFNYVKENWMITNEAESIFCHDGDFVPPDDEYDGGIEDEIDDPPECVLQICGDDIACRIDGVTLGCEAADDYNDDPGFNRTTKLPDDFVEDPFLCSAEL